MLPSRVVVFSLRAEQAQNNQKRVSNYLTLYIQISWSIGFLSLVGDLHRLLGCLLLNNLGTPSASTILNDIETNDLSNKGGTSTSSIPLVQATTVDEERTTEHLWYGRVIRLSGLFSLAPMITGIASGTLYPMAIHEASIAPVVQHLRYSASSLESYICS